MILQTAKLFFNYTSLYISNAIDLWMKNLWILLVCISVFTVSAQKISYVYQDKSLEEIKAPEVKWNSYKAPIYRGLDNGVYWFKIELEKQIPQILSIPESHISRAYLYGQNTNEIIKEKDTRYITFKIDPKVNPSSVYYLKVNCLLEGRIPVKIEDYSSFYKSEMKDYIIIGLYNGIVYYPYKFIFIRYFKKQNVLVLYFYGYWDGCKCFL